ncbi:hypothetical protein DPX16_5556 [Anabarilius grahami]|uniref:HECT domain-containing protein n=1 Tax=Anabarilius grahami TaxID=495550 RepID=A0A3N0Y9R1_ANAGA|nr:hypothetical protein DPX16_5556 [Anabarilius grahami]
MKLRKQSTTEPQSEETPETSKPKSRGKASKRQIEIGWIHADNKETKQVRTKQGGGTRKLAMDINAGYNEILKEATRQIESADSTSNTESENNDDASIISLHSEYSEEVADSTMPPNNSPDWSVVTDHAVVPSQNIIVDQDVFTVTDGVVSDPLNISDPEITFGPNPGDESDLENTVVYVPPETTEIGIQTKEIIIRHGNCLHDMISEFSDPETLTKQLEFRRLLPDNSEEAGSGSGVVRDVYTNFWQEFYDRCTLGTTMKVPFIRHDFQADTWKAVGRIFLKGYKDCQYIPIKLALPFMEEMLFGAVYSDLIECFLQFVSTQERDILQHTLQDFSSVEFDELLEVLDNYECRRQVSADNFPEILKEISHKELVQKPMFVLDCWKEITQSQISLTFEELKEMYAELLPTAKKVIGLLKFPADMTAKQREVAHHLKRYIREMDDEKLGKFLRFCTGCHLIVSDCISVEFAKMSDFTRRPIGRTCGMFLHLCENYDNFPDFRSEFNDVLESNIWIMDIV